MPTGTYFAVVHGVRTGQEGPASNEVRIDVAAGLPGPPGNLTVTVAGLRFTARWGEAARATSYRFKFGTASGTYPFVNQLGNVLTASGTLTSSATVFAVVSGVNAVGEGSNSNEVAFSRGCNTVPDAPTGLTLTDFGLGPVLTWEASMGCPAASYVVQAAPLGTGAPIEVTTELTLFSIPPNVPPGTYFVVVFGVNHAGRSERSNEIVFNQ